MLVSVCESQRKYVIVILPEHKHQHACFTLHLCMLLAVMYDCDITEYSMEGILSTAAVKDLTKAMGRLCSGVTCCP